MSTSEALYGRRKRQPIPPFLPLARVEQTERAYKEARRARDEALTDAVAAGWTYREVAAAADRDQGTVWKLVKANGR